MKTSIHILNLVFLLASSSALAFNANEKAWGLNNTGKEINIRLPDVF